MHSAYAPSNLCNNNAFTYSGPKVMAGCSEASAVSEAVLSARSLGSLTPCDLHDCRKRIITLTQPVDPSRQCPKDLTEPLKLYLGLLPFLESRR
jgi:hypothetical protein